MDGFFPFTRRFARNCGTEYTCPFPNCGAIFPTEDEMYRHLCITGLFGGHKSQMRHIYNNFNAALIRADIGPGTSDMGECIEQSDQLPPEVTNLFNGKSSFHELSEFAEITEQEAKRRAEVARLKKLCTLKGRVESFAKLRGLDIEMLQQYYTV